MLWLLRGVRLRYWLTLATGLVECLCFAGVFYGWASLVFILKASGYFSDQCVNATGLNGTQYMDCSKQDENFSLVFTIASIFHIFIAIFGGFFFDHFGTLATRLLSIALYTTGTMLIAFSHPDISNILFPGLSFIATGGIMLLMANMQVGNLFDTHRSTIITLYTGAYGSSAITFLIIKVAFEKGISLQHAFFFLSACSIIHLMRTFILMPKMHIPYPLPEGYTYGMSCEQTKCNTHCFTEKAQRDNTELVQGEEGIENATSEQESPPQTSQTVSHYTNIFAYIQLCGILCAPLNGLIIDRFKGKQWAPGETEEEGNLRSLVLSLFLTALQCLLFSICATIPVLPLQYLTFVLQVFTSSFALGGNSAFLSIVFPVCHFGKLVGVVNATVTVVLLLQFPCIILVNEVLDGDPLYINIALCILCLAPFIHPAYVYSRWRTLANQRRRSAQPPPPHENAFSGDNEDQPQDAPGSS
ncbi:equilibrative nucleobase transporter 1-like isoform X2 [Conger conger]|uniref:equilibrative nucleobase transporter 1-like isoform X2 n=1 Tax=Conger conger TaxID=82655 RepID=UPI002A5A7046|nr:equilibrative nucleobase transporter 1-like isoform X2 [Conger conger]